MGITKIEYQEQQEKAKKLQWAKDFLSYNVKEGIYDPDYFDDMTDDEIINFAQHEMDLADYMVDSYMENYPDDKERSI
jgi:hypothetical protein